MANISAALAGSHPRMIDEWQEVPEVWDAVRFEIDRAGKKGMFILTGSSSPPKARAIHSVTGRIARLRMNPMTLFESGVSQGEIAFASVVGDAPLARPSRKPVDAARHRSLGVRGGWPANTDTPSELAHELPLQYIQSLIQEDISRYDNVERDPGKMDLLLKSLAGNNQTIVSKKTLLVDVGKLSDPTLNSYLNILNKLFVLQNIPAWSPNVRSRSRLRVSEKVRFVDPSLAVAALRMSTSKLMNDLETFGLFFKDLVARDIFSYAEVVSAKVYHYCEAGNQGRGDI